MTTSRPPKHASHTGDPTPQRGGRPAGPRNQLRFPLLHSDLYPNRQELDGKYRRIQVKLADGKSKLAYRRGYYADDAKQAKTRKEQPVSDPLLPLMKRDLPDFSQIIYKVRVA